MVNYITRRRNVILLLLLFAISAMILFPFFWMLTTSFKTREELTIVPPKLLPRSFFYLENYVGLFRKIPFGRYLVNSFFVATVSAVSSLIMSSLAGYGLSKYKFPLRDVLFFVILGVMMLPFHAIAISLYRIVNRMGLANTYVGLVIPFAVSPFGVFLMREAISVVPNEYIESAQLEGYSDIKVFFRIVLPNCQSSLTALAVIKFLWSWNEFFWPLLVITSPAKYVVTMGLSRFVYFYFREYNYLTAASVVSVLPILILFIAVNKGMVRAITMQGLKI